MLTLVPWSDEHNTPANLVVRLPLAAVPMTRFPLPRMRPRPRFERPARHLKRRSVNLGGSDYEIRPYHPGDLECFLDLFEQVFERRDPSWFEWKYEQNPFFDHVPIIVAFDADVLVGARCFLPMRMRHGSTTSIAIQPCDTMVHPDHRRRGLMTWMTRHAMRRYVEEASFFFNTPNTAALEANRKLGWRIVTTIPTFYRIESMQPQVPTPVKPVAELTDPLLALYRSIQDRNVELPHDIQIERRATVPAQLLADLATESRPTTIHAERDITFFNWRYENPMWTYTTYLAWRDSRLVGAMVTGTGESDAGTMTNLVDLLPLPAPPVPTIDALLAAVIQDHQLTDVFAVLGGSLASDMLERHGFIPDSMPLIAPFFNTLTLAARPLRDTWVFDGRALDCASDWTFSLAERDTS